MQSTDTRYSDTWQEFQTLEQMAQARVTAPPPAMGGAQCPAVRGTLAAMDRDTQTWRHLTQQESIQFLQAVLDTGMCCQGDTNHCPIRTPQHQQPKEQSDR